MKIHDVEQNTPEWDLLRAGKPTASEFKRLITSKGDPSKSLCGYAQELAAEMYAGCPLDTWNGNKYTDYGHEIEDEAALAYSIDAEGSVSKVGFVTDDDELYGCSPDRFVGDSGMLEIKCLPKRHVEMLLDWKKRGDVHPDFMAQTQGQLFVAEREWDDLLFYRPRLPSLTIRIMRDEVFISRLATQISACIEERDRVLNLLKEF